MVVKTDAYGTAAALTRRKYRKRAAPLFAPQVHVPQFPRDMGRKDKAAKAGGTLAMTVGASGGASYDAIVKQGANRDKWVASDHSALVPKLDSLKDEVSSFPRGK